MQFTENGSGRRRARWESRYGVMCFTTCISMRLIAQSCANEADSIHACMPHARFAFRRHLMRGVVPLLILTAVGSLHATAGLADSCHGPSAPSTFPDPSTATEQDILAAQQSIKQYLTEMESVLKCVDSAHNDN